MDALVIKENITEEAKVILKHAMNNFCIAENKEEKEMKIYIAGRHNYWLEQGFTSQDAMKKAVEDYEWIK